MNRSFEMFNFRAKAVLCMTLAVAMHVVVGCGGPSSFFPASSNTLVALTPDHPMAQALAGTSFSNATAIVINPATNQFGLVFPDGSGQQISGTMTYENGQVQVNKLTLAQGSMSATLFFGANQEITNINTSAGPSWQRTVTTQTAKASQATGTPSARTNNLESYLAANADLMQYAQQMDSQGVTSTVVGQSIDQSAGTGQSVKADAAFWPLAAVFGAIIFIPLGIAATIIFILELVVVINAIV